jgi:hypothetical protein
VEDVKREDDDDRAPKSQISTGIGMLYSGKADTIEANDILRRQRYESSRSERSELVPRLRLIAAFAFHQEVEVCDQRLWASLRI